MNRKIYFRKANIIDNENAKIIKTESKHDKLEYLKKYQNKSLNISTT